MIVEALGLWRTWQPQYGPAGPTGDDRLDAQLSSAFRTLVSLASEDRAGWLMREVLAHQARRDDRYVAELVVWWLDLQEAQGRLDCSRPASSHFPTKKSGAACADTSGEAHYTLTARAIKIAAPIM